MRYDIDKIKAGIGKAIKEERVKHKLLQKDLAIVANVGQSTVAQLETQKRIPNTETFLMLSNALDVNMNDLFKRAEELAR